MARGITQRARRSGRLAGGKISERLALLQLLQEFAATLLTRGMTPRLFGELTRWAFVRAAAERSRMRNGRVNHSRVAAQTGLSRADVKRLLRPPNDPVENDSPVERV